MSFNPYSKTVLLPIKAIQKTKGFKSIDNLIFKNFLNFSTNNLTVKLKDYSCFISFCEFREIKKDMKDFIGKSSMQFPMISMLYPSISPNQKIYKN